MTNTVEYYIPRLKEAIECILDPTTPQNVRASAYQACEDFKESSPLCAQCGLFFSSRENTNVMRHFGLQLLEHCVKYRWNNLTPEEKIFLKENTMCLLQRGTFSLLNEESYIKEGLSKIVVEMMKREWPQQWPTLMNELNALTQEGQTQTELVLFIFLRLAEEVVVFSNVPPQRRREMYQAITQALPNIFDFLLTILQTNVKKSDSLKQSGIGEDNEELRAAYQVAQATLNTMTGYVDWIPLSLIFNNHALLLQVLCLLLSHDKLQNLAAECLLLITSRKGKLEERKPMLLLFSADAMESILLAAEAAAKGTKDEMHYMFLKRLCQVLVAIGKQLSDLWGPCAGVDQPDQFGKYLQAMMAFTTHSSRMLVSFTQNLWSTFLKHEHISKDRFMLDALPKLADSCKFNLYKIGFPSQDNFEACQYARMDFDGDEDYNWAYTKYRSEVSLTIRMITELAPTVTFDISAEWLEIQMRKPIDKGPGTDKEYCNLSSPSVIEWDALSIYIDCVMTKLFGAKEPLPPVEKGIQLLKNILNYDVKDPLILSCVLSCVSALFIYIRHAPDILPVVLEKIFSSAVFNMNGQTKATRSKAVKNVRRHACSVLVKICKQYPDLLLPGFDQLYSHIKNLSNDPEQLSRMEKCTLMEALILISNEFKNFDKQCRFLEEIMQPVKALWLAIDLKEALWNVDKLITFVGLDQAPVEPSTDDTCGINRSNIIYCINVISATLKRSSWPEDIEEAKKGGFALPMTENSEHFTLRNPVTPHILVCLDNVLALLRSMNSLWLPENLAKRHKDFEKAYDITDYDKMALLGHPSPMVDNTDEAVNKKPLQRMQNVLKDIHDNCYHILSNATVALGSEFYSSPNLANSLINSVFTNLDCVPNHRLKGLIRISMKTFIKNCPQAYYQSAVIPVMEFLCPYMLQRLSEEWKNLHERAENRDKDVDDDDLEAQEIIDDQLTRQVTREYIEMIYQLCMNKSPSLGDVAEPTMEEEQVVAASSSRDFTLSDLGQVVFNTDSVFPSIVVCIFTGLTWNDTSACHKCVTISWPLIKQMIANNKLNAGEANYLFTFILHGLQQHGEHEGLQAQLLTLGTIFYENVRPLVPELANVLLQVQSCTPEMIKNYEDKLFSTNPQKLMPERRKKEGFKKLVQAVIGKNVGQQFKRDVYIKDLPPMYKKQKAKRYVPEDCKTEEIGLCALFNQNDDD